ncbi:MAG: Ig-like domain-containing protein [bacterium]
MGAPPGGEIDDDPPRVVLESVFPGPGAAGVAADSAFVVAFSERVDRRSVLRSLRIFPPVDFQDVDWRGDTLSLVPAGGWSADRPTLIRIEGSARDSHGLAMGESFQTIFTRRAHPDSGVATGRAWAGKELDASKRFLVFAWTTQDSAPDGDRWPVAIAETRSGEEFRLSGLALDRTWTITGVIDADGSLRGLGRGGAELDAPETVAFADDVREVRIADFLVGTLDSLGTIQGEVAVDSARTAWVVATPFASADSASADWLARTERRAGPLTGGPFSLSVPTGVDYRVGAFVDVDGDSSWQTAEPSVPLESPVSLRFRSVAEGLRFDLVGLAPWPVDSTATSTPADSAATNEETTP